MACPLCGETGSYPVGIGATRYDCGTVVGILGTVLDVGRQCLERQVKDLTSKNTELLVRLSSATHAVDARVPMLQDQLRQERQQASEDEQTIKRLRTENGLLNKLVFESREKAGNDARTINGLKETVDWMQRSLRALEDVRQQERTKAISLQEVSDALQGIIKQKEEVIRHQGQMATQKDARISQLLVENCELNRKLLWREIMLDIERQQHDQDLQWIDDELRRFGR